MAIHEEVMGCCTDGSGFPTSHRAEGWLICPDDQAIQAMCRTHADRTIAEYAAKLGERWTFRGPLREQGNAA